MIKDVPAVVRVVALGARYATIGCWIGNRLFVYVDEALSGEQRSRIVAEVMRLASRREPLCIRRDDIGRLVS